jgi:hypothetical protein
MALPLTHPDNKTQKMVHTKPILSLLQYLSSGQIESLIMEQHLLKDHYQFYYALDNHDVHRYCFPGNLTGNEFERNADGEINYELETDRITAYDDFFSKIGETNYGFFLDEYFGELIGLRDQIIKYINVAKAFNHADSFNKFLTSYVSDAKSPLDDFTLYITVATGVLRNGAQRFNGLLGNPYFSITPEDLLEAKIPHKEIILEALRSSQHSDNSLVDHIIGIFADSNATRHSKRTDSRAIARVISINKHLLQYHHRAKVLFLFLSSTETSRSVFSGLNAKLPRVNNQVFNFHRTVEQLFINRLLCDLGIDERIRRLEAVRQLIQYREQYEEIDIRQEPQYQQLEEIAENALNKFRLSYVNVNLARIDQFRATEELNQELERLFYIGKDSGREDESGRLGQVLVSTRNLKKLFNGLKKVSEKLGENIQNLEYLYTLESAFKIREIFSLVLKRAIAALLQQDAPLRITRGKDDIKATGQHLPIVFRCKLEPHSKNLDEIAELYLNQFAFYETITPKGPISNKLRLMTATIYENPIDERSLAEKLVFCLYLLVLPEARIMKNKTNDDFVEEFLDELFRRELMEPFDDGLLYSDFLYTYSWVLRRNRKFKKALEFAKKGIDHFPDDARFYHSRFLINVCEFPSDHALHLEDIKRAANDYEPLLAGKSPIIAQNIRAALLNSYIYSSTYIISEGSLPAEEKARELGALREDHLEKLKQLVAPHYADYPEFLHTDAFLDLEESRVTASVAKRREMLDMALAKIKEGKEQAAKLEGINEEVFGSLEKKVRSARGELSVTGRKD